MKVFDPRHEDRRAGGPVGSRARTVSGTGRGRPGGVTRQARARPSRYTAGAAAVSGSATPAVMWTNRDG
ncbi:hypothetical protein ADL08_16155 [Streptomyces sp. NRRL F-6492]|nr:hypothetical protein ADL08_16155 [Streptomyces sp. NRRL F-6492]